MRILPFTIQKLARIEKRTRKGEKVSDSKIMYKDKEYSMNLLLQQNLAILGKKILDDWDWLLLVTGSGKVRVGKSVLGLQVACYWANMHNTEFTVENNIVFNSEELINKAKKLKPYSVIVYDEAREGLEARKSAERLSRNLLDFFAECGQLNLFIIIIMPDFFELKKNIAITRSVALINVYCGEGFKRGFFSFYNDKSKKLLYLKGKIFLNYLAQPPDFRGTFRNFYPVSEKEYRDKKRESLGGSKREYRTEKQIIMEREEEIINNGVKIGLSYETIGALFGVGRGAISERLRRQRSAHKQEEYNDSILRSGIGDLEVEMHTPEYEKT